ncbi:hypothetical protein BVG79_00501 [Ketogulonicigenium robustum]|uniref:Uncharacterized protein n=1 Tax=Ketogulonicigenium robustum TaxID=92947 RepID=A0A1W6NX86_9RHOB|nr:hypothetical protein [Ketogulonicigenium robustum]ARO13855.1 hypothetical protein BVG79_00501 [Ketogulonicigenium robustum]
MPPTIAAEEGVATAGLRLAAEVRARAASAYISACFFGPCGHIAR